MEHYSQMIRLDGCSQEYIKGCTERLNKRMSDVSAQWHLDKIASNDTFFSEDAYLHFPFEDGVMAKAPVQIIASQDDNGLYQWAWADNQIPENMSTASKQLLELGKVNQLPGLIKDYIDLSEYEMWSYLATIWDIRSDFGALMINKKDCALALTLGQPELVYEALVH